MTNLFHFVAGHHQETDRLQREAAVKENEITVLLDENKALRRRAEEADSQAKSAETRASAALAAKAEAEQIAARARAEAAQLRKELSAASAAPAPPASRPSQGSNNGVPKLDASAAQVAQLQEEVASLRRRAEAAEAAAAAAQTAAGGGAQPNGASPPPPVIVEVPVERVVEREVFVAVTPRGSERPVDSRPTPSPQTSSPNRGTC